MEIKDQISKEEPSQDEHPKEHGEVHYIQTDIHCLAFNEDSSLFAVGHDLGFRVYETESLKKVIERDTEGGIGVIALLGDSNILALRGGGIEPLDAFNVVSIWDDEKGKVVAKIDFNYHVSGIKLTTS